MDKSEEAWRILGEAYLAREDRDGQSIGQGLISNLWFRAEMVRTAPSIRTAHAAVMTALSQ